MPRPSARTRQGKLLLGQVQELFKGLVKLIRLLLAEMSRSIGHGVSVKLNIKLLVCSLFMLMSA
jgi:hypothetical protein